MKIVAIVAYENTPAVCSSMMMHVEMIAMSGYKVIMLIQEDVDKSFLNRYDYPISTFRNYRELPELFNKYGVSMIWCTNPIYVLKLNRITKLPIFLWKQGDTAAESMMRHHNYIRKWLLQAIDAVSLRKVAGVIYVSDAMRKYYETKYRVDTKSIIVPCLSEFADCHVNVHRIPQSYVYIGGLSVWQCFEETLQLYSKIRTQHSVFHIITHSVELAKNRVLQIIGDLDNIEIYEIKEREKIPQVLSQFQYGFLIRKKDVVNQVASPIKFLEYLSCGVNVIMTDAIPSYAQLVQKYKVGTVVDLHDTAFQINQYNPSAQEMYEKHFDRDLFIQSYKALLK